MRSLVVLEKALLEENIDDVKGYILEIDRKTSNEAFRLLGEYLGLTTMEIEGVRYSHLGSTSQIMGYSDPSGLSKLMSTYQIMTPKIGWYGLEVRPRIREVFNLNPKDSEATFISYEGLLIAGMQGTTDGAKKIKLYLLAAERTARIGIATIDEFKYEAHRLRTLEKTIVLAAKISRMEEGPFKDSAIKAYERLTGESIPRSGQKKMWE